MSGIHGSSSTVRLLAPNVAVHAAGTTVPSAPPGMLLLPQIEPVVQGFVFGDGSHPTTRLCAGAVDLTCRLRAPRCVLDIGTGTGILARIARARGAQEIFATDIDPAALDTARANAALEPEGVPIHCGDEPPDQWGEHFDLVIANILEAPLIELAGAISRATRGGGVVLISGFTRPQSPRLRVHYERLGLRCRQEAVLENWALLMFERQQGG
jgi:ribosomal protein L11 methyltransferase